LPCFPAMAPSTRRLPSLVRGPGEPSSPALSSTTKALRLPIHVSMVAYCFRFHCPRVTSAFVFAAALLGARRTSSRPGRLFVPAAPTAGLNDVDANGISQVFRRSILCLCSVPGPRSSRRVLTRCGHLDAAPAIRTAKASAMADFGADSRSFGTRCSYASRVALPHTCKARFRLAGSPLPGGRRTLWTATKGFSSFDDRPPFLLS
jgi:hypothetical protein